jgi:hypothetical protein
MSAAPSISSIFYSFSILYKRKERRGWAATKTGIGSFGFWGLYVPHVKWVLLDVSQER